MYIGLTDMTTRVHADGLDEEGEDIRSRVLSFDDLMQGVDDQVFRDLPRKEQARILKVRLYLGDPQPAVLNPFMDADDYKRLEEENVKLRKRIKEIKDAVEGWNGSVETKILGIHNDLVTVRVLAPGLGARIMELKKDDSSKIDFKLQSSFYD